MRDIKRKIRLIWYILRDRYTHIHKDDVWDLWDANVKVEFNDWD